MKGMHWMSLILLVFSLLLGTAFADDAPAFRSAPSYPTDKHWNIVHSVPARTEDDYTSRAATGLQISFTENQPLSYTGGKWTATATGGVAPYTYTFQLLREDADYLRTPQMQQGSNAVFTSKALVPGSYYLYIKVEDSTGSQAYTFTKYYTLAEDSSHPTIATIAKGIVAKEAPSGTEYQKAVALYKWLTSTWDYDYTYTYYSAEYALLNHTGVCDACSQAYMALLNAAGITCGRVIGYGNGGGHAWNVARLDGVWVQLDPTWDDDSGDTLWYFGLTDQLMYLDHTFQEYEGSHGTCTSLSRNYLINSGYVQDYLGRDGYTEDSRHLEPLISSRGTVEVPYWIHSSGNTYAYVRPMLYYLFEYALNTNTTHAIYDPKAKTMTIRDIYPIELPASLTTIKSQAFIGLPPTTIHIPDTVTSIADDAFNTDVCFICKNGSYAAAWADQHGITHREQ